MIYSLMWLKLGELFWGSAGHVTPVNVPVSILIIHQLVAELFQGCAYNYISALRSAQVQKRLLFLWTLLVIIVVLSESFDSYRVNTVPITRVIGSRCSASRGKSFILLTSSC